MRRTRYPQLTPTTELLIWYPEHDAARGGAASIHRELPEDVETMIPMPAPAQGALCLLFFAIRAMCFEFCCIRSMEPPSCILDSANSPLSPFSFPLDPGNVIF